MGTVFVSRFSTGAVMVELSVVIVGVVPSDTYGTVVRLILMAGPPEASSMARCPMEVKALRL